MDFDDDTLTEDELNTLIGAQELEEDLEDAEIDFMLQYENDWIPSDLEGDL